MAKLQLLYRVADQEHLQKEFKVLDLFKNINQSMCSKEHLEIIRTFKIKENVDKYLKPAVLEKNIKFWQNGILPKNCIFSIQNDSHLEQAIALFELLYYSENFDIFHKTAVVSRHYNNSGLFLYSFSVALIHRKDCYGLILPPIYEVNPHYFFHSDIIHEAYRLKQIHSSTDNLILDVSNEKYEYSDIKTYLQDIGIQSFFYYYTLHYPSWMSGPEFGLQTDKVGELFYYTIQQIIAHYNLERFSNGLEEIEALCYKEASESFCPDLMYPNGSFFPLRTSKTKMRAYEEYLNFEKRVYDVIDQGYAIEKTSDDKVEIYCKEGMNILGNILLSNSESPNPRFHGPILKNLVHFASSCPQKKIPTAIEHSETALRDPTFYKILRRILNIFLRYKNHLNPYTEQDLVSPGINVSKLEVEPLITYVDDFTADISNALYYSDDELTSGSKFAVKVKQRRLNCKPFKYKIFVSSDMDQMSIVKVYFGPKDDVQGKQLKLTDARANFVLLDRFFYGLKSGLNVIERSSLDSRVYVPDRRSFKQLNVDVLDAINRKIEFKIDGRENWFFFPRRHMIPRGSLQGTPFQFYVIIYKYIPYKQLQPMEYFYPKIGTAALYHNDVALGYPLDRKIDDEFMFSNIQNSIFQEVKVFHKNDVEVN